MRGDYPIVKVEEIAERRTIMTSSTSNPSSFTMPTASANVSTVPTQIASVTPYSTNTPSVTAESASTPLSKWKSGYLQSRLAKNHREKDAVRNKLAQARVELGRHRDRETNLRQDQNELERTLLGRKRRLDDIDKAIKKAQDSYQREKKEFEAMQKTFDHRKRKITMVEGTVRVCEADVLRLEKAVAIEFEGAAAAATRQADILDLNPSEMAKVAKATINNQAFKHKVERAAEGTATPTMRRDIQSELFGRMTEISKAEFQELMLRVLSTRQEISGEPEDNSAETDSQDEAQSVRSGESADGDGNEYSDEEHSDDSENGSSRLEHSDDDQSDAGVSGHSHDEDSETSMTIIPRRRGKRQLSEVYSRRRKRSRRAYTEYDSPEEFNDETHSSGEDPTVSTSALSRMKDLAFQIESENGINGGGDAAHMKLDILEYIRRRKQDTHD